jgi:hypothetical protein
MCTENDPYTRPVSYLHGDRGPTCDHRSCTAACAAAHTRLTATTQGQPQLRHVDLSQASDPEMGPRGCQVGSLRP